MEKIFYKEESYQIIGLCMEVHRVLGKGFSESVYKDALEIEFRNNDVPYKREKRFDILYKGILLPHFYNADFVCYDRIILEAKAIEMLHSGSLKQTLNYLAASRLKLGLLVNFGEDSLQYKRVVL